MDPSRSPPPSSALPPKPTATFSPDLSGMPAFPRRASGHRRAHSEIVTLPDDLSFDSDLGVVGAAPSLSDDAEDDILALYMDMDKINSPESSGGGEGSGGGWRARHQHSQSMDGGAMVKEEWGEGSVEAKKAMSAAKLADLALVDPKRAKRIWANRQSAARSKERKMRYIGELERKVQTLQTEATTLSAQLTMLQRDTTGLTSENSELKLRLQTMEQQVHLQDALNDALREEVQRLKMITGQALSNGGQLMNYGSPSFAAAQPFYPQNHNMHSLMATHQLQHLNIHSQQQQLRTSSLPQQPVEVKIRAPGSMTSTNQNQRDGPDTNTPQKE